MSGDNRYLPGLGAWLLACFLGGCGYRAEDYNNTNPYAAAVSMENTPVVDYAVPQMSANVLVDLCGYPAEGKKEAAVKGRSLPETFRLVDAATGETVYGGAIEETRYSEELGLSLGYVDFSGFDREGDYYLECDIIGRSYSFVLQNQLYAELFEENCQQILLQCQEGTLKVQEALVALLAYEWYGQIFPDGDASQIPDMLEKLKVWVTCQENDGVREEDTALYAAFLAKFSYLYQHFDREYATDCVRRAATVFGQVTPLHYRDGDCFLALTELYRATGLSAYGDQILDYKSFFEQNGGYLDETAYLLGAMTYMVTRQRVDVEMCEGFMGDLMERAEEISDRCGEMAHPVTAGRGDAQDLMKRALEVSCVNYVMNNYQYTGVVEEFLHYLMGRNRESVNFYEQDEERADYLLLLTQLTATASQQK